MNSAADARFDVALIGTSLSLSIAAAALAKAGYNVLHLDSNEYYGGESASLTIKELQAWVNFHKSHPDSSYSSISLRYPSGDVSQEQQLPDELLKASRHYSISLSPSVIPSSGKLIESLVKSGVSRYGGFRLLEGIALYTSEDGVNPSIVRVPSSKEDVFKDKGMSLLEKRKLMKFLLWNLGEFDSSPEIQGSQNTPLKQFLQDKFSLPPNMSSAVAYAIAHSSSDQEPTLAALSRARSYLQSAGRYGNSSFLVGHYGGMGELAQGFCRSCAVHGGTYILGRNISSITRLEAPAKSNPDEDVDHPSRFSITIDNIHESLYTNSIIGLPSSLPNGFIAQQTVDSSVQTSQLARAIAIIDHPISFPTLVTKSDQAQTLTTDTDTVLIIFPPGCLGDVGRAKFAVSALVTGEGTASCPRGQYIVYLSTPLDPAQSEGGELDNPQALLRPYLERIISLSQSPALAEPGDMGSTTSISASSSILELFYTQRIPVPPPQPLTESGIVFAEESSNSASSLTEVADLAATEGERLFWQVVKMLEKTEGGTAREMWPPLSLDEEHPNVEDW